MNVNNNSVLIISPESWGKSKVSKHHYALTFANKGYTVYFLNIVFNAKDAKDEVCSEHENIKLIKIYIPKLLNFFRFYQRWIYNFLLKKLIKERIRKQPCFNLVISFDCNGVFTD